MLKWPTEYLNTNPNLKLGFEQSARAFKLNQNSSQLKLTTQFADSAMLHNSYLNLGSHYPLVGSFGFQGWSSFC